MYQLAPSILSADFNCLGEQSKEVEAGGAKWLHFDVMDGNFVPSISFGMPVLVAVRGTCDLFLDVHLMIENPDVYIEEFARCGADMITVHVETTKHLDRTIQAIKAVGCKVGLALNPATPLSVLEYILDQVDMVLLMSVNPGFGGQKYIPYTTRKIVELRKMIDDRELQIDIQVDGGISENTLPEVLEAGANIFVAGSAVFQENIKEQTEKLLGIMNTFTAQ